jgi:hypothetical protein
MKTSCKQFIMSNFSLEGYTSYSSQISRQPQSQAKTESNDQEPFSFASSWIETMWPLSQKQELFTLCYDVDIELSYQSSCETVSVCSTKACAGSDKPMCNQSRKREEDIIQQTQVEEREIGFLSYCAFEGIGDQFS